LDSANDPIGTDWWKNADTPWQCLAACIEFRNALRLEEPTKYESGLPIQLDGSCNGLQHYAALGRDPEGAAMVNLIPADKPQDLYTRVAEKITKKLEAQLRQNPDDEMAKLLVDKVKRKTVKQTIMTNVYGVTMYGGGLQVKEKLKAEISDVKSLTKASMYLSSQVFACLHEMFGSARKFQHWLEEMSEEICFSVPGTIIKKCLLENETFRSLNPTEITFEELSKKKAKRVPLRELTDFGIYTQPVEWRTRLNLPVVQPYFQEKRVTVKSIFQSVSYIKDSALVNHIKQRNAISPNFVHSLDASHMHMTATECSKQGITFAAVHDSFWCHPCDVDQMNEILREKFIELHRDPQADKLAEQFRARYADHYVFYKEGRKWYYRPFRVHPTPDMGDFDLDQVRNSTYFFS
jgi:DNA-directed RNA polymerase